MVNIMLCILNMFLIYRMVEPIKRLDPQLDETVGLSEKVGQSYTRILGNAWQLLKQHKELRGWILFFALLDSFAATYYFYFQNYLSVLGYNGKATSFYLFAAALFGIFGAKFSSIHREETPQKSHSLCLPGSCFVIVAIVIFGESAADFCRICTFDHFFCGVADNRERLHQ